ncbi:MAG: UDP-N-acetylglucosamine--N-acetylmuramyl-(pentapeptide) pyrophosphoryl-undecaprenol N-acetylglucosamine transferase [Chloroflexota bacterium]
MRVLLAGGGTGGHVYPSLAVVASARELADSAPEFQYAGSSNGLERPIVERAGLPFRTVDAGAVRGRSAVAAGLGLARCLRGISQAREVIRRFQPHVVLATGGFVGVPVVLAARLSGVPTVVYLPDLRPGWAVRLLARVVTVVGVSFEEVRPYVPCRRVVVTGYPVRPELLSWTRARARVSLGIPVDAPVTLVIGGSRGARTLNQAIQRDLTPLLERSWVIHASGAAHFADLNAERIRLPGALRDRYHLFPYLEAELAPAMAAATLVVARSGASVLGELPAVGAPGVLVPGPFAGTHQRLNADFLASRGAAVIVDDQAAQHGALVTETLVLLADAPRVEEMARRSQSLARPGAARALFRLVAEVAERKTGRWVEGLA